MKVIPAAILLLLLAAEARATHCVKSARYDKTTLVCITEDSVEIYRKIAGGKQRLVTSAQIEEGDTPRDISFGDTGTGVRIILVDLNTHARNDSSRALFRAIELPPPRYSGLRPKLSTSLWRPSRYRSR